MPSFVSQAGSADDNSNGTTLVVSCEMDTSARRACVGCMMHKSNPPRETLSVVFDSGGANEAAFTQISGTDQDGVVSTDQWILVAQPSGVTANTTITWDNSNRRSAWFGNYADVVQATPTSGGTGEYQTSVTSVSASLTMDADDLGIACFSGNQDTESPSIGSATSRKDVDVGSFRSAVSEHQNTSSMSFTWTTTDVGCISAFVLEHDGGAGGGVSIPVTTEAISFTQGALAVLEGRLVPVTTEAVSFTQGTLGVLDGRLIAVTTESLAFTQGSLTIDVSGAVSFPVIPASIEFADGVMTLLDGRLVQVSADQISFTDGTLTIDNGQVVEARTKGGRAMTLRQMRELEKAQLQALLRDDDEILALLMRMKRGPDRLN